MFSCRDVTEHVSDHLEDKLSGMANLRFRMHVFICRDCRHYLEQMRQTIALLGALPHEQPSPKAVRELLDAVRKANMSKLTQAGTDK